VNKLTIDVAKEFGPRGVRLNVICPGPVVSGMTPREFIENKESRAGLIKAFSPLGRLGVPDDIAYMAVYLGSDESSWVTGSTLVVDGGANISG
jgi:NAD(P)-dependent dehydrogenase (short-subunit alcohol dehydrogenase family)